MRKIEYLSMTRRRWLMIAAGMTLTGCRHSDEVSDVTEAGLMPTDADTPSDRLSTVGMGWARTSVNATIFRRDALTSTSSHQYIAYYDDEGQVVVGQRERGGEQWTLARTGFTGRPDDAHNGISLMADGDGYLHLAWDHHVDRLRYARSIAPETIVFSSEVSMIGEDEDQVTYPEFHALGSGDLLFAYRQGRSGNGRMILNRYSLSTQEWARVQSNLLDGQGERNAYWQLHVDRRDTIHLSWVWRESTDVASNHDLHYARSDSLGRTWVSEFGAPLTVPMNAGNTAPIWAIAQGQNLINQTSMTASPAGSPCIATYFRDDRGITNIMLVYFHSLTERWVLDRVSDRAVDFDLAGNGTRSLPISRPLVLFVEGTTGNWLNLVYRDAEQGDQPILARARFSEETGAAAWTLAPLPGGSLDRWEPVHDSRAWGMDQGLHLYLQRVGQQDAEGVHQDYPATSVQVLTVELASRN